jgi:antitoxin FitA
MATLTIRDLDDDLKARLRIRAAENGRSMEAEVRAILADTLNRAPGRSSPPKYGLGTWLHEQAAEFGYLELELPKRTDFPRGADFAE